MQREWVAVLSCQLGLKLNMATPTFSFHLRSPECPSSVILHCVSIFKHQQLGWIYSNKHSMTCYYSSPTKNKTILILIKLKCLVMVCHSQWDTTFCVLFFVLYVSSVKQRIINTRSNLLNQIKLPKMCDRFKCCPLTKFIHYHFWRQGLFNYHFKYFQVTFSSKGLWGACLADGCKFCLYNIPIKIMVLLMQLRPLQSHRLTSSSSIPLEAAELQLAQYEN